ncbi:F-box protein SKIP23-like [Asparagus officinalis]|nr:F-box protein SKIP23-like [Asparagus officinalis]
MASGTVPSSHPDWANLLGEVLTLIAKRLSAVDYCSFSAVCTSWASIASPENCMPRPLRRSQPYLLFSGDGAGDCEQSDFCTLFDFQDNSFIKIHPLPEIRGKWIVGSQFGWVTVIDELGNPGLLNPFNRSRIELPSIRPYPYADPVDDSEGSRISHDDGDQCYTKIQGGLAVGIRKLVLSSNPTHGDFAAVAIGRRGDLMFARSGEEKWNLLYADTRRPMADVIYRDGKFLALTIFGKIYAFDLHCPFSPLRKSLFAKSRGGYSATRYLVDSSGVLLHVFRKSVFVEEKSTDQTNLFEISSLDPETGTWIPVRSLGDRSLFIGSWCSVSLSAKGMSGLEENRVYFTDDFWDILTAEKGFERDIGIFDLSSQSFKNCYPPELRLTWPPPIWITPPHI